MPWFLPPRSARPHGSAARSYKPAGCKNSTPSGSATTNSRTSTDGSASSPTISGPFGPVRATKAKAPRKHRLLRNATAVWAAAAKANPECLLRSTRTFSCAWRQNPAIGAAANLDTAAIACAQSIGHNEREFVQLHSPARIGSVGQPSIRANETESAATAISRQARNSAAFSVCRN